MSSKRRRFERSYGERRYRKLFLIAVEGKNTERQYFSLFNDQQSSIHVKCLEGGNKSSPEHVLERMQDYLEKENLRDSDEAWLVVDKDEWTEQQLRQLYLWAKGSDNFGFALSNPKFEYWLLLHFEQGDQLKSAQDCDKRLKKFLPGYDKNLDIRKITRQKVEEAICRAEKRDNPPCADWPRSLGCTTVYKLVRNIVCIT